MTKSHSNINRRPLKTALANVVFTLTATASFSPSSTAFAFTTPTPKATAFQSNNAMSLSSPIGSSTSLNSHAIDAEDEAMMLMMKANTCAHSETCSIEEAENYLNEVLHIQYDCASGSLQSESICEDISFPTEVIANLRDKIQNQVELSNQGSAFKIGWNPIFLTVLVLYTSSGILSLAHNNPDSFTIQEWMYALKGGYLDAMVSQYLKYGGLSPIDADALTGAAPSTVVPLTLQEWYWSIRDGYLGRMITESQHYGGYHAIDVADDAVLTTPFTSQEWSSAVKDGYLSDMIEHYMRNGGL